MRRTLLLVLTWGLATSAAMGLAWRGVQLVSSEVTERSADPISRRQVVEALRSGSHVAPGAGDGTTVPGPPPASPAPPGDSALPGAAAPSDPSGPAPSAARRPPATTAPAPALAPSPAPAPMAPAATTPTTAVPAPATTAPPPPSVVTRTIDSVGGQVAVRYESGRVELVWARPKPGFTVDVNHAGPDEVDVRFESRKHESRVRAFWRGGVPSQEVREEDS